MPSLKKGDQTMEGVPATPLKPAKFNFIKFIIDAFFANILWDIFW